MDHPVVIFGLIAIVMGAGVAIWLGRRAAKAQEGTGRRDGDTGWNDPITPADQTDDKP